MKRFQNKVSLITGGNRGIGRAIAFRLASEGSGIILLEEMRGIINRWKRKSPKPLAFP